MVASYFKYLCPKSILRVMDTMNLRLSTSLAAGYKSPSQQTRVITESWVAKEAYCPACGGKMKQFEANRPVADFACYKCNEEYELKSQRRRFSMRIVDGEYDTMMTRLESATRPSLMLLHYDAHEWMVRNLIVIPKRFFVSSLIEKRPPLSPTAQRADWVGCNILIGLLPATGRVHMVKDATVNKKQNVIAEWRRTSFLEDICNNRRGWTMDVMNCIERLNKSEFTLSDMYRFSEELQTRHSENRHIRDKIRQQLQVLRDRGYLKFVERGHYRLVES